MIGSLNVSGGTGLNVFAQLTEPRKKDGIWIKTEETILKESDYSQLTNIPYEFYNDGEVGEALPEISKYKYDKIELLDNMDIITKGVFEELEALEYSTTSMAKIDGDIYFLCGSYSSSNSMYYEYFYKYNLAKNEYTRLTYIMQDERNNFINCSNRNRYLFNRCWYS